MRDLNLYDDIPHVENILESKFFKSYKTVKVNSRLKFGNNIKSFYGFSCGENTEFTRIKAYSELQERIWSYINLANNNDLLAYDLINHKPIMEENIKFFYGLKENSYIYNDSTGLAYHPTNFNLALSHGVNELLERDILTKLWLGLIKIDHVETELISEDIYLKYYTILEYSFILTICIKKDFISLGSAVHHDLSIARYKSKCEAIMVLDEYYFNHFNRPKRHEEILLKCHDSDFIKYVEEKLDNSLYLFKSKVSILSSVRYVKLYCRNGFLIRAFSPDFKHYKTKPDSNNLFVPLI